MLLESETDLRLLLGAAAGVFLLLALLGFVLLARAAASLREAQNTLARTETGADRTERRMFQILQAIPVALVETDMSGKFTFANRAAHQLLGRKDAELLGLRFHSATWGITYPDGRLIPPDLLPAARALRGQTVKGFQHLIVNPNTRKKMLVSVTAMPILNEMGEVIGSSSAIVETESLTHAPRELEEALKPRYFDIASLMLLALDCEGKVREINAAGAAILGLTVDEIVGRDWIAEFLPPERREDARADFAAVIEGRSEMPDLAEGWVVRPDGERRLLLWRGSTVRDESEQVVATLSSGLDVTELKAAEAAALAHADAAREAQAALLDSQTRFSSVAEALEDSLWIRDLQEGRTVYLNPAYERVWGDSRQAALNDTERWRALIVPEDAEAVLSGADTLWAEGRRAAEFRIRRPDTGEERILKDTAFVINDGAGAPRYLAGVTRDVTESRRDATRLQEVRGELERRTAEHAAALEAAHEERRRTDDALAQAQRLETVGRLTGGMAHDFNNLLTVVIGALDMILRHTDRPDRVRRLGEAALAASKRGEKLTRQLLVFSRRQEFRLETLDIAPLVQGLEPLLRSAVDENITLEVTADPGAGAAELDAVQFESALLNLVVNARDALDGARGRISIRAERAELAEHEIADTPAGAHVRVSVSDTGAGMTPDVAARAFEPFFTTKEIGKGTGLGLAHVHGFARQSGGGAKIVSAPGEGATVSIYLPLKAHVVAGDAEPVAEPDAPPHAAPVEPAPEPERSAEPTPEAHPRPAPAIAGCKVLLIEHDAGERTLAEDLLRALGCEVVTAPDGPSALALIEHGEADPAILIADVAAPGGMGGVELAEAARRIRPGLKALLSSGQAGEPVDGAVAGGWSVLSKPYESDALAQALRQALQTQAA